MRRVLIVVGALLITVVFAVVGFGATWFLRMQATEQAAEEFCDSLQPGLTVDELAALIDLEVEVFDGREDGPSNGGNGPQPTIEQGEFICWCGTNFEAGELRSVNTVTCID